MLSKQLILCCPLVLLPSVFPSIRVFSNELALRIRRPKYMELQLQHRSFQWIFRVDFLSDWLLWFPWSPRGSHTSSPAPQFKSISSLVLSHLYGPMLTPIHDYWKNHSFDYTDLWAEWKENTHEGPKGIIPQASVSRTIFLIWHYMEKSRPWMKRYERHEQEDGGGGRGW